MWRETVQSQAPGGSPIQDMTKRDSGVQQAVERGAVGMTTARSTTSETVPLWIQLSERSAEMKERIAELRTA
jgi:hypothetical protein